VYHSGPIETISAARKPGGSLYSKDSQYDLRSQAGSRRYRPTGDSLAVSERRAAGLRIFNMSNFSTRRAVFARRIVAHELVSLSVKIGLVLRTRLSDNRWRRRLPAAGV
jgi:hypothetical protein